ncbi:hypothetical protein H257_13398 [Aphanomyces astaci]|uniref:SWIM-type domain-containing protein n=1 Tax=Aphanomyces astaci TaxID=112090 RepID=W4FUT2_APHAT|nr:hypothetical protein H257_13398 [Aphanomyces astaci]ETV71260.1 hypothetical protein H257_13398 [Aphanomyces astaci]|eukprot:XP_009839200.1 hypothetical protein H257_13398 [Aphanomyces astaci]
MFNVDTAEVKAAYLQRWLALLRDNFGLHPAFVHMDKDSAQIAAATAVWTGVKLSLYLWHMDRAIRARFIQGNVFPDIRRFAPTNTLLHVEGYTPAFPAVWVHGAHVLEESFCDKAVLGPLLSLMKSHYKAHPFMSMHDDAMPPHDKSCVFYIRAVEEIYNFCKECSASYLFVYLFNNWYSENEFKRWARSQCPTALATLRTSMMAEAHFNCLKYRFLKDFQRPRLDLLCFIIVTNIQEWYIDKFIRATDGRISYALPSWESRMNAQWKVFATKSDEGDLNDVYDTSVLRWTCTCPSYAYGEFLLCKHLVHRYILAHNTKVPPRYKVRQLTPPMWVFPTTKDEMLRQECTKKSIDKEVNALSARPELNHDTVSILDDSQLLASAHVAQTIQELSSWLIQHASDIQHAPRQLAKVQKLLHPIQAYRKSILAVNNMRKRQRTNQASSLTVMHEPPQQ